MLIKNGRIVDPATGIDEIGDVLIQDGKIVSVGAVMNEPDPEEEIIDAAGLVVCPGFVDVHVHFREPGQEHKETLQTGSMAAAAGGYTSVICMANTKPVMDSVETLTAFREKAAGCPVHVYTISSLTKGMKGLELVDMEAMIRAGAVGFSDDGIPNNESCVVLEGLLQAKALGVPIAFHEEDPSLNRENGIHHGVVSESLGVYGAPDFSEAVMIARDTVLCKATGAPVHIQHISTCDGIDLVRWGKKRHAPISAEACPHHFVLTDEALLEKKALAKMNPPLRPKADVDCVIAGLKDGTIEIIATDHAPHTEEEKRQSITDAPSGIIGLETALSLGITYLVEKGHLSMISLIEKMSTNPAKRYQLPAGRLEPGFPADITLFDPNDTVRYADFYSKSSNSPFTDITLRGRVMVTIVNGKVVYPFS